MSTTPAGALEGVRVIDLTHFLAGPFCTQMLADQGADVIKVEPLQGDATRGFGPFHPEDELKAYAGYFASVNRNKRSVSLDLKSPAACEALAALIDGADVVVENYRAGVMERFGLSYEALAQRNPRLVYATIRGFGDSRTLSSPYADWPAYDVVAQAFGGIMAITGEEGGQPTKIGPGIGDLGPAMFCAFGIVCAVLNARRTGQGQFVDVSMVDSVLALCERVLHQHAFGGLVPAPQGNHHPFLCPFGTFPTQDGLCTITAYDDPMFRILCEIMGQPGLSSDPRFATYQDRWDNREALIGIISAFTSQQTKHELLQRLGGRVPFGPVYDVREIVADPHFQAREMVVPVEHPGMAGKVLLAGVPVKMSATPGRIRHRAPLLGEHTREILGEIGCSSAQLDAWLSQGVIRVAQAAAGSNR
ncbi:CoA transferase [Verticiella sediminum]|uniref:CoA transferase n=1 Tax=Verticiella sediminum TaxID=1247510 RepID=A0A556ACF4_9BURK|nr:CoA transferase [Verticiella sediminum]TSH90565.1 CoA transferase [Verticiella sediminum]